MAKLIVGLTGGIGSGKTTVGNEFARLGIPLVDADLIARDVVAIGSEGLKAVTKAFGDGILHSDGSLNRSALRTLIFKEASAKDTLNGILHPLIREGIHTQLENADGDYVILIAPLLFENGLDALCHTTLLVDVPEHTQISRTHKRDNVAQSQVEAIIAAQMSRQQKCQKAAHVLDNDRPFANVIEDINTLHQTFLKQANTLN